MKMERYQGKGVARGAFCNDLKRKGMDGGNRVLLAGSKLSGKVSEKFSTDSGRLELNPSRLRINYHEK
jgi:hypothetical protein